MFYLEKLVNMHSMLKEMLHKQQFLTSDFYLDTIIYLFTIYKERIDNRNATSSYFNIKCITILNYMEYGMPTGVCKI